MSRWWALGALGALACAGGPEPRPPADDPEAPPAPVLPPSDASAQIVPSEAATPARTNAATDAAAPSKLPLDRLEAVEPKALAGDPEALTDSVFQFHVETRGSRLNRERGIGAELGKHTTLHLAGTWPDSVWALTFRSDPSTVGAGTLRLFRWHGGAWKEMPKASKRDHVGYALAAWTKGRALVFRGVLRGGNLQSFVIPEAIAVNASGALVPAPSPVGLIVDGVAIATDGAVFASARTPPHSVGHGRTVRPHVVRYSAVGQLIGKDELPTELGQKNGQWLSDASLHDLCIAGTRDVTAVGIELPDDGTVKLVTWRFRNGWSRQSRRLDTDPEGQVRCTSDGTAWVRLPAGLVGWARDGSKQVVPLPHPSELVTTDLDDVFIMAEGGAYRLRR